MRQASGELPTRLANMMLRIGTLGSRFVLTIYLAKSLGIDDLGVYGFVMGLIGFVPPVTGWGINYFVSRHVVGLGLDDAMIIVRDRLLITILSLMPLILLAPFANLFGLSVTVGRLWLVVALVACETVSADLQPPLIAMGRSLLANALLFCRASAWVIMFVGVAWVVPSYKTLDVAFSLWLAFNILQFIVFYIVVVCHADQRRLLTTAARPRQMLALIRRGLSIYPNDVGNVGLVYVDRYVVGAMLTLHDLGIFTLYWSIANSVNAVVTSAIVQPSTPLLISAHMRGDDIQWRASFKKMMASTLISGFGLGIGAALTAWGTTTFLQIGDFADNYMFLLLLLVAVTLRSLSEALNLAMASRHMDRAYSVIGFCGMLIAAPANVVGLDLLALQGVALASCATQIMLISVKFYMLHFDASARSAALRVAGSV